jgi:cytochrome c oxidase subunit 3
MTESHQSKDGADQAAHLAHHFDTPKQQYDSAKLGMWIFLLTEVLFFSGLFCFYAVYRANNPQVFVDGHHFLDTPLGALNTMTLIFSSLTMALAVRSAQLDHRRRLVSLLTVTILCGLLFMGVKYVEYKQKWDHRLVPGQARIEHWFSDERTATPPKKFQPDVEYVKKQLAEAGHSNLDEEELAKRIDNLRSYMGIYFTLTGLHALHVIIGVGVLCWILTGSMRGLYGSQSFTPVDLSGLYWHLVDLIWIYVFPLLYLIP